MGHYNSTWFFINAENKKTVVCVQFTYWIGVNYSPMFRAVLDFKRISRLKFRSEWRQQESLCGEIKDVREPGREEGSMKASSHWSGLKQLHANLTPKLKFILGPKHQQYSVGSLHMNSWLLSQRGLQVATDVEVFCFSITVQGKRLVACVGACRPFLVLAFSSPVGPTPLPSEWSDPASGGGIDVSSLAEGLQWKLL